MKYQTKPLILLPLLILTFSLRLTAGSDDEKEKTYPVQGIRGVDIKIACELNIRQGEEESLRISAEKDIFHLIEVEQRDSIIYLTTDEEDINYENWDIEVYLSVKDLNSINIGGAAKIRNAGTLKTNKLSLDISGAADLKMEINVEKLLTDFSGAVKAELEGLADYVVMDMSGASKVDAEDLITKAFYLDFSGFGKAEVYAEEVLKIDMSGMGVIRYSGNPKKVEGDSSGMGVIKAK